MVMALYNENVRRAGLGIDKTVPGDVVERPFRGRLGDREEVEEPGASPKDRKDDPEDGMNEARCHCKIKSVLGMRSDAECAGPPRRMVRGTGQARCSPARSKGHGRRYG